MIVKQEKGFVPVTITLETEEELNRMYALANYEPINEPHSFYRELRRKLHPFVKDIERKRKRPKTPKMQKPFSFGETARDADERIGTRR
jgi:hypothetical protein